jgi:hypothetical protein
VVNKGGRPRKPIDLFALGFPISSRSGLDQVARYAAEHAARLRAMHDRALLYGTKEMEALAEPLMGQWAAVMGPAEQQARAAAGTLAIMHSAAGGKADSDLLLARQRAEQLMGVGSPQPSPRVATFPGPISNGYPVQPPGYNGVTKPPGFFGAPPPVGPPPPQPCPMCGGQCPPATVNVT